MIRQTFLLQAKPGMAAEYERRHREIWPELAAALKAHGVSNFSISLHAPTNQLFGFLEIADESVYNRLNDLPVCHRWWKYMTEVLECEREDSDKGREDILREVFYLP
ncbi:L-rhamnose mutarotase [Chitinophaga lutea]